MKSKFRRNLLVGFGVSLVILIVSSAASVLSILNLISSSEMVTHTYEVINNLNGLNTSMINAETGQRGYLLTGKTEFLEPYKDGEQKANLFFDKVMLLTSDNPIQQKNLLELKPFIKERFILLELRMDEKRRNVPISTDDLRNGKKKMDEIKSVINRLMSNEQELMEKRSLTTTKFTSYSFVLIIVAAILALVISILFFIRILSDYNERSKLQEELQIKEKGTENQISIISNIASEISNGNYKIRVKDIISGELARVASSLNNMAASLENSFETLRDKDWLQAGVTGISDLLIGEKDIKQLSKDTIDFLSVYTKSQAAALFVIENNRIQFKAGYCFQPSKENETIDLGQGLIGEVILSGKYKELEVLRDEDIQISYAMGKVKPKHVVAIPLIDTVCLGAIELATASHFSKRDIEFLQIVSERIAIAITSCMNRNRVQSLLEETQAQSEELQTQHNELESANVELEAQSQKLQTSEEELRVQQEELQQINEELQERSVLLEEKNTEIEKKSEALELSSKYKSEFLANMSHELRTPLNSILLLSRLLAENNDKNMNDEQVEFATVIQSSGNGLLGLIDEILDLSKIEAGKMELELMDVTVKEISDDLRSLFNEVAKEKKLTFKIEVAEKFPLTLKTDKVRLEQILKNLISNALKFTLKGSVTLSITRHPENEKTVCFKVSDTGIGIPHEKQPLIFEAFQQADGSTKRKYGGTGLGLSISRELAKLLGGEITLKSKSNEGSEFTLCLPLYGFKLNLSNSQKNTAADLQNNGTQIPNQETYNYISQTIPADVEDDRNNLTGNDKIILIVEDDTHFAKSLLEFTRKRGYKGIITVRGDEALNLAINFKPSGILLDIQLPVKSGWEVMDELKSNSQTKHIPVHIMSSHKLKQESLLKGAVDFLDKPFAFEKIPEIFNRIERLVNKESQKVLIIEDNTKHAKALAYYLETFNIKSEIRSEMSEGFEALSKKEVDCVILDMGIPDNKAYEILERLKKSSGFGNLPVIVFTGKSLSIGEESRIKKYADSIVIKTAHSYNRMLDEVSLFLHLVEENKKPNEEATNKLGLLKNILTHKTVLIVDDDVRNIYSLSKSLEVLNMNVITANDGKEALEMLNQNSKVDIVLLDMMMPNMDGYEAAAKIREKPKFKDLPIIAITAKAMSGDREKCISAGASDYITKPVDIDQLLSLLRVWLYDKK